MLQKPNKLNYASIKSYNVICLPNCLGMVCEKVAADILSEEGEVNYVLHKAHVYSRRLSSVIDAIAQVVGRVQEA